MIERASSQGAPVHPSIKKSGQGVRPMEMPSTLRRILYLTLIIVGLASAHSALAEDAAAQKLVPSLIVMNAQGASLQGETLTLNGVAPSTIVFADRPVRAAGHMLTAHLLEGWGRGG